MPERPAFADDLDLTLREALGLLARGAADRRHGFHHPAIATLGLDGRPRVRTVILRGFDAAAPGFRFHTDARSDKVAELQADPRLAAMFYDAGAKAQVRLEGEARLHAGDPIARAAWASSRPMSRQCYGIVPGPGVAIPAGDAFALPDPAVQGDDGFENFVAVTVSVTSLDWLWLAHGGHRRARFERGDGDWYGRWLAP